MNKNDTTKLLTDCSSGIQMGISALDEILPSVESSDLEGILVDSKKRHSALFDITDQMLSSLNQTPIEPNPLARGMSWFKTNLMIGMRPEDSTAAELITDGCNMGIKSLNKSLNNYSGAHKNAKNVTQKLIELDKKLALDVSAYL